jgi:YggT family protein
MAAFDFLIHSLCSLIWWIVIIHVVLSWLISFNIVNMNNQFVYQLYTNIDRLLEPMLRPIRRFLPNLGGLDLSPILLLIGVQFLEILLRGTVLPALSF